MIRTRTRPRRYEVTFEAIDGFPWRPIPPSERLQRLLKSALRSFGLRCVEARSVGEPQAAVFRALGDAEDVDGPFVEQTQGRGAA